MASRAIFSKYGLLETTIATKRYKKDWYSQHLANNKNLTILKPKTLIIGDSLVSGLSRFADVWERHFAPLQAVNLGIGGDRIQHVLWRLQQSILPVQAQISVVLLAQTM